MKITTAQIDQILSKNLKGKTPVKIASYVNGLGTTGCWIFINDGWAYAYGVSFDGERIIPTKKTRWHNNLTKKILNKYNFQEIFGTTQFA
jgi:hypothetical protein